MEIEFKSNVSIQFLPTFQSPDVGLTVSKESLTRGFWELQHTMLASRIFFPLN